MTAGLRGPLTLCWTGQGRAQVGRRRALGCTLAGCVGQVKVMPWACGKEGGALGCTLALGKRGCCVAVLTLHMH